MEQVSAKQAIQLKTDDKPIRYIGLVILFITFGVFGSWSFIAPLDSAAVAPGVITVKSYKKTVQHLEGGLVEKLLVKEGNSVKENDVLILLDDTQIKAQLEIIKGQYITFSAQEARLLAERDSKKQVDYPEFLNDKTDKRTLDAKLGQNQIFIAGKKSHDGGISVLNKRIGQLKSKISGLRAQRRSSKGVVASYNKETKDLRELLSEGFADKQRLRDMERRTEEYQGKISELTSTIASTEIQIGETKLQILQLSKERQEEVVNKLSEVQAQLFDIHERLRATEDTLQHTKIRAPTSGIVLGLMIHTTGGVIRAGEPILDIVPQQAELIINAKVAIMDIDRVKVGMRAEVRFSAFKQAITPEVEGTVINLSADSLMDEQTGLSYYQAKVELTPESLEKLTDFDLLPGMPAEVFIITGERTLVEYLMQPISNAFSRSLTED